MTIAEPETDKTAAPDASNSRRFAEIGKLTANSFNAQKQLIKRVLKGQSVSCAGCRQPLNVLLPEQLKPGQKPGIFCKKGCTDIELDMEAYG
ncbi:hypothetical protein [Shewanella salipaludis]|uniref:Uncharacterized protein n=1 Tax=Shewanella salipaludis TaxID=2723052 RepID=A0A972FZ91_9GAMM|nr:hypothetical protein [Shewanella salipaludis]NMH64606.1 hypothetical protein [Shewanella salipaludis]